MAFNLSPSSNTPAAVRTLRRITLVTSLCGLSLACSGSNGGSTGAGVGGGGATTGGSTTKASGGGTSAGGTAAATGGTQTGTGGSSTGAATGGSPATGGSSAVGTTSATGGAATGGTSAVGTTSAAGGAATGGTSAVGTTSATGGAAAGGAATGGKSATSAGGSATGGAATGGAATGGAASGGSSSCAPATLTMVSSADYQLKVCNVTLDVNPQVGGRVTSLTITNGSTPTNVIVPYACTGAYDSSAACNSAGSTFWTSPQSGWDGDPSGGNIWPPLTAIDGAAYTPTNASGTLTLVGSADTTLGASVTKVITADASTGWISLTFTIKAQGKAVQAAPWQITRVPRGGIIFFPLTTLVSNTTNPQWVVSPSGGYEWINDTNQTSIVSTSGAKIIADGGTSGQANTFLAYALNGNLFIIKYPDIAQSAFAPNESDTEVYPGSGYIELEAQGAYATIASGASSAAWTVQWRVVPIPASVTVSVGSASLISFVQQYLG